MRPFVERVITLAKKGDIHRRRLALSRLRDKEAVSLLFTERVGEFAKREGGYTRIYKLAIPRLGDAADMAIIEFVGAGPLVGASLPAGGRPGGGRVRRLDPRFAEGRRRPRDDCRHRDRDAVREHRHRRRGIAQRQRGHDAGRTAR